MQNLVKVYDLYQDEEAFFIVTDLYTGGDVFDVLEESGPLSEDDAAIVMNNLLNCINYCHKRNLIHRDMKPENILLDAKRDFSDLKVIDFGLARYVDYFDAPLKGLVGSAYYVAPQVIDGEYTNKCDVWSCGVIAYALISGFAPFDASTDALVLEVVYDGRYDFDDPEWDDVSILAKDFIAQLLTYDEDERPSAEKALQHPWLKKCRKSPRMNNALVRSASRSSLKDLSQFTSKSNKLKQAACAMIASQLLMKDEKAVIDKAFRALDKGCSGQITKEDLNSSFADLFDAAEDDSGNESDSSDDGNTGGGGREGDQSRANMVDEIFEHVNFSGSGSIQYSEFAIVTMLEKNMVDDAKLRTAFKFFDRHGKGYICKDDIKEVLKLGNHASKRIVSDTATKGRKDKITFEDFKLCVLPPRKPKGRNLGLGDTGGGGGGGRRGLLGSGGGPLGGPLDESSRRRPMDESSRRYEDKMGESSRRALSRSERAGPPSIGRMSIVPKEENDVEKMRSLEELEFSDEE